jgi:hypothetical protein
MERPAPIRSRISSGAAMPQAHGEAGRGHDMDLGEVAAPGLGHVAEVLEQALARPHRGHGSVHLAADVAGGNQEHLLQGATHDAACSVRSIWAGAC